jgi:hypothetical protein
VVDSVPPKQELPTLSRFFPAEAVKHLTPDAPYLDVILYSREEIRQRELVMGNEVDEGNNAPWGIVRVKAQVNH